MSSLSEQAQNLLALIPETGSIGNVTLRKKFYAAVPAAGEDPGLISFFTTKAELLATGLIKLGRGKGGSVKRTGSTQPTVQQIRDFAQALENTGTEVQSGSMVAIPIHPDSILGQYIAENPVSEQIQTEEEF